MGRKRKREIYAPAEGDEWVRRVSRIRYKPAQPQEFYLADGVDGGKYGWIGSGSVAMVADCCDRNDVAQLSGFFSCPEAANRIINAESNHYPFRLFSRLMLRAISSRHIEIANILIQNLQYSSSTPSSPSSKSSKLSNLESVDNIDVVDRDGVADLLRRLAKLLLTLFTDQHLQPYVTSWLQKSFHITTKELVVDDDLRWSEKRWRDFVELYGNVGGDGWVWSRFRASSRAMIAQRLFTKDKTTLNETYLPYFTETAFSTATIRILAQQCRIYVSKSQLCKSLFVNNRTLDTNVLSTILESWLYVEKPTLKDVLRLTSDDLQKLLYITDHSLRRERLDAATTSGPKVFIPAEDLQRYHLTAFHDDHNPVPWIHATITINRTVPWNWMNNHIISFYLSNQINLRQQVIYKSLKQIDQCIWSLPYELIQLINQYIFSHIDQLIAIDTNSIPLDEQLAFKRLWSRP